MGAKTSSPAFALCAAIAACATLADTGGGDVAQPNAGAGPFREIRPEELGNFRSGRAPNALQDDDDFPRDVSVLDPDGDPTTLEVFAYVAHTVFPDGVDSDPTALPNEIGRQHAADGRSFDSLLEPVLAPDRGWEGGWIGAPSALTHSGRVLLYYAAAGGIGLATSADGLGFEKVDAPVLEAADAGAGMAGAWESMGVPTSPFVMALADGRLQMLYEVPLGGDGVSAIGEAISFDGIAWERIGAAPLLAPTGPSGDPLRPNMDAVSAGAPCAMMAISPMGRSIEYVYYSGVDETGRRTIAMAARFGTEGPLERAVSPVFGSGGTRGPDEPWVVRLNGFTLLFATQRAGTSDNEQFPAVAVGVAPADIVLPPPG